MTTRTMMCMGALACAALVAAVSATAAPFLAEDSFDGYAAGSAVNGQGGWSQSNSGTTYRVVGGGGAGGTNGVSIPDGSHQLNWTGNAFDWGTLAVGDKVIARMDFQANGSGQFDDDRVGWVLASNPDSSSYHFGVQLDNTDNGAPGGLVTYFRDNVGTRVLSATPIPWASLGASGSNWYREELTVTKLTSALGPGGAQVDVSFLALDGSGNPIGAPLAASYGTLDTSAVRGFSGTVYPMFKNYSSTAGNADNAYFEVTPEPATMGLLSVGLLALLRRRRRR